MLNVGRLIKGSIAALAVVAGGATAMAVVSNGQDAPTASISVNRLSKGDAPQAAVNRFRLEFAAPGENIWDKRAASAPSLTLAAGLKDERLPTTRTRAVRQGSPRLIDGNHPFAAIGWQRSLAAAAPSLSKLDGGDQGAFSRGCAACQNAAGSVPKAAEVRPHRTIAATRPAARG
jgi:hypothetical protein